MVLAIFIFVFIPTIFLILLINYSKKDDNKDFVQRNDEFTKNTLKEKVGDDYSNYNENKSFFNSDLDRKNFLSTMKINKFIKNEVNNIEVCKTKVYNKKSIIKYINEKIRITVDGEYLNNNLFTLFRFFCLMSNEENEIGAERGIIDSIITFENQINFIFVLFEIYDMKKIDIRNIDEQKFEYVRLTNKEEYKKYLLSVLFDSIILINRIYDNTLVNNINFSSDLLIPCLNYREEILKECEVFFGNINCDIIKRIEDLENKYFFE